MAELKNYASESQNLQFVLKGKAGLSVAKVFQTTFDIPYDI